MAISNAAEAVILSNRSADGLWRRTVAEYSRILKMDGPIASPSENTFAKVFPSGEVYVQVPINIRERKVHLIGSFHRPDLYHVRKQIMRSNLGLEAKVLLMEQYLHSSETDFREFEKECDAIRRSSAKNLSVYLTQYPDARQDKKDESRVSISAKLNIDNITSAGEPKLERIGVVDLHARQIQGMTNLPVDEIRCFYLFVQHLKYELGSLNDVIVVFADASSHKRFEKQIQAFGFKYGIIDKSRVGHGLSKAENYIGHSPKGLVGVLFDDMVDGGGTAYDAAKIVLDLGVKELRGYFTHGIFSAKVIRNEKTEEVERIAFAEERFENLGMRVFVSDSVPRTDSYRKEHASWLTQFTIAPYMADLIFCNETGNSHGDELERYKRLAMHAKHSELERELKRFFVY